MSLEDDISGLNSSSLFVHGNASSRCPPLREAVRHMRAAYRQPHTHAHKHPQSTSGGGALQLTCYEIRPYGLQSIWMLFLSRRELNIADKKGSMCVWGARKTSQKGECFRKAQTMYHLHTAGCVSDTGLLLWGTIALLLNGCCLTGSHIKASDPVPDARQWRGEAGKTKKTQPVRWHDDTMSQINKT